MSEYTVNANRVAKKYGLKIKSLFVETRGNFFDDGNNRVRDIFKVRLSRNGKQYTLTFGMSEMDAYSEKEPSMYDILACVTKIKPGTFENFCTDYGYDTDSRKAEKTYNAVCKEYKGFSRLFPEGIPDDILDIA